MIERPWSYHADGTPVYSLAEIIRKRAAATPAGVALARAGQESTFADLDIRSSKVAAALQAAGVTPGDRVVFIGASGPAFVEVMYGTAKCGAIFTAVNNRLGAARGRGHSRRRGTPHRGHRPGGRAAHGPRSRARVPVHGAGHRPGRPGR